MTSQVFTYSGLINESFPIAGTDNPSQGFRDNFRNIKQAFTVTNTELSDLQSKAILKSPLTDTGSTDNTMGGTVIAGAGIQSASEIAINHTLTPVDNTGGQVIVDYSAGTYHKYAVDGSKGDVVFRVQWPDYTSLGHTYLHRVRLEITNASTQTSRISFAAGTGNALQVDNSSGLTFPFAISQAANPTIFEIQTIDNGATQLVTYFGGPYITV
jgi:hypothetical protein